MDGTRDASDTNRASNPGARVAATDSIDSTAVHRIEFAVDWPPGHVAAYLVGGSEPLLIDAGMAGERGREELLAGMNAAGYDLADVAHLVLTHPHVDHIGQVGAIVAAADPTVYAPAGIRERFARDSGSLARVVEANARAAGVVGKTRDRAVDMAVSSLERNRDLLPPSTVDRWIGADASASPNGTTDVTTEVAIGEHTFTAIPTPGHQADHHCYETTVDGERVLFAGDAALAPFRPVLLHVGLDTGVERALDAFETSLDRLATRPIDRVFPGHGPIHAEFEDTLDRDRRSLRRLVAGVSRRLDGEAGTTAAEAARDRAGDGRDFTYLLPEVVAALSRLDATGRSHVSTDKAGVRRYRSA